MADAHLNLANLYLEQQRYGLAEAHYGQALKLRPNWKAARRGLEQATDVLSPTRTTALASRPVDSGRTVDFHLQGTVSEESLFLSKVARADLTREMTLLPGPAAPPSAWGLVLADPTNPPSYSESFGVAQFPPQVLQAVLAPVVTQFAQMQRQMADQFQQAVLMMGQMFQTMQREQSEGIRQELAQLNQLTQELHRLQLDLMSRSTTARAETQRERKMATAAQEQNRAPTEGRAALPASGPTAARPAVPAAEKSSLPDEIEADEAHAWICQRIETVQRDRQHLWQRIVGFLQGESSATASP
jgi:hypothetical protein